MERPFRPAAAQHAGGHDPGVSSEVEEARMFAKVAQVQFRAVLDALNEQVNRLGQFQARGADRPELADDYPYSANGPVHADRR